MIWMIQTEEREVSVPQVPETIHNPLRTDISIVQYSYPLLEMRDIKARGPHTYRMIR